MATSRGMFALSNKTPKENTAEVLDPENVVDLLSTFTENQLYVLGATSALGLGFLGCYFMFRTKEYPTTSATRITVPLSDGRRMPLLSIGFKNLWLDLQESIYGALNAGIRHFYLGSDLEEIKMAGEIFRESRIDRGELWITVAIPPEHLGFETASNYVNLVLDALKMEYIDLLLVGWVGHSWTNNKNPARDKILRRDTWRAASRLQKEGLVKSIGLENFNKTFLMEILGCQEAVPSVCTMELHPKLPQIEFVKVCQTQNITCIALEPFGGQKLLEDESIVRVSKNFSVSSTDLLVDYFRQRKLCLRPTLHSELDFQNLVDDIFNNRIKPQVGLLVELGPLETANKRFNKANPNLWEV